MDVTSVPIQAPCQQIPRFKFTFMLQTAVWSIWTGACLVPRGRLFLGLALCARNLAALSVMLVLSIGTPVYRAFLGRFEFTNRLVTLGVGAIAARLAIQPLRSMFPHWSE